MYKEMCIMSHYISGFSIVWDNVQWSVRHGVTHQHEGTVQIMANAVAIQNRVTCRDLDKATNVKVATDLPLQVGEQVILLSQ